MAGRLPSGVLGGPPPPRAGADGSSQGAAPMPPPGGLASHLGVPPGSLGAPGLPAGMPPALFGSPTEQPPPPPPQHLQPYMLQQQRHSAPQPSMTPQPPPPAEAEQAKGGPAVSGGLWGSSDVWGVGGGTPGSAVLGAGIWGPTAAPSMAPGRGEGHGWGDSKQDWQMASMKLRADAGMGPPGPEGLAQSLQGLSVADAGPGRRSPAVQESKDTIDDLINIMDSPSKMEKLREEQVKEQLETPVRKGSKGGTPAGTPASAIPSPYRTGAPQGEPQGGRPRRGSDGMPRKPASGQPKMGVRELTKQLERVYQDLVPTEEEAKRKEECFRTVLGVLQAAGDWPNFKLQVFGSGANNLCIRNNNDLDMCFQFGERSSLERRDVAMEKKAVERMGEVITEAGMSDILVLPNARVPIVKFTEPKTGVKCDICVNNILAVYNTRLLFTYGAIDPRVRQLAFIVKHWAKRRQINEAYRGTLSSYAYVIMCIHLLQTQDPPILPCLQALPPTVDVRCGEWEVRFNDDVEKLKGFGAQNTEPLGRLLYRFFEYWAWRHSYTDGVISIRTGGWLSKADKEWTKRVGNERHLICIEDPFALNHDLGRVVDRNSIAVLRDEFLAAARILRDNPNPIPKLFAPYSGEG